MCEKVNFNVIEKTKNSNTEETKNAIIILINNLIIREYFNLQNNIEQ